MVDVGVPPLLLVASSVLANLALSAAKNSKAELNSPRDGPSSSDPSVRMVSYRGEPEVGESEEVEGWKVGRYGEISDKVHP